MNEKKPLWKDLLLYQLAWRQTSEAGCLLNECRKKFQFNSWWGEILKDIVWVTSLQLIFNRKTDNTRVSNIVSYICCCFPRTPHFSVGFSWKSELVHRRWGFGREVERRRLGAAGAQKSCGFCDVFWRAGRIDLRNTCNFYIPLDPKTLMSNEGFRQNPKNMRS